MQTVSSKNGAIICDTYNGSTLIGTETCGFTVKVASGSNPITDIDMYATDSLTINLCGSRNNVILGITDLYYTVSATPQNGATIASYKVTNGNQTKTTATGTFVMATSETIDYTVTDSRGLSRSGNITFGDDNVIKYVKLTHSCTAKMTPSGVINFTVKGNFYNGSFGSKNNTLTLSFRVKELDGTYGSWTTMNGTINKSGNTYEYSGSVSGLDYTKTYVFQTRASDSVTLVESTEKKVNSIPLFDWGETDFNHNTSVRIKNNKAYQGYSTDGSAYYNLAYTTTNNNMMLGGGANPPPSIYMQAAGNGGIYVGNEASGESKWFNVLGAMKALTTTYTLECTCTPASNYSECNVSAYLIGNCLRMYITATRSSAATVGNMSNETVMTIKVRHDGKIDNVLRAGFASNSTGGVATFDAQQESKDDTYVNIKVTLAAAAYAGNQWNGYWVMPVNIKCSAYV